MLGVMVIWPKRYPPFLTPPLKRGSKRLTFFWVHIFHTRSGGSIQTPLTNGGPFCPLLGGDPSPPGGGYPSIWGSQICWKFYVKKLVSKVSKFWSFLGVQTFVPSLTFLIKVTTLKVSIFMIQKGYTIILSPFLRGLGPYPPKIGVPPYPREGVPQKGRQNVGLFLGTLFSHP